MPAEVAQRAKRKTEMAHQQLLAGIKYIPDDKLDWAPMGKAKSALEIGAECASTYIWEARMIRGEHDDADFDEIKAENYPTREEMVTVLNDTLSDLLAALDSVEEENLSEKRQFMSEEDTLDNLVDMAEWRTVWKTGQLNYIQLMLGDTETHWE